MNARSSREKVETENGSHTGASATVVQSFVSGGIMHAFNRNPIFHIM